MSIPQSLHLIYRSASPSSALERFSLIPNFCPSCWYLRPWLIQCSSLQHPFIHNTSHLLCPRSLLHQFSSFFTLFFQSAQNWVQCYSEGVTSHSLMRYSVCNTKYDASFLCRSSCLAFSLWSPVTSIFITTVIGKFFAFASIPTQCTVCFTARSWHTRD